MNLKIDIKNEFNQGGKMVQKCGIGFEKCGENVAKWFKNVAFFNRA